MKSQKLVIFVFVVLCFSIWGLDAKIVIDKNELTKTIHCDGDEVIVNGNENELTIKGECSKLYVPGNKNIIYVEAVAVIDTPGNKNTVTWEKGIDGKKPSISNLGTKNKIKKAEVEEEAEDEEEEEESHTSDDMGVSKTVDDALSKLDVLGKGKKGSAGISSGDEKVIEITGNMEKKTLKLKGQKLIITGNFNKLKVKGTCSELLVRGNSNVVKIASVGKIKALGSLNKIYWESGLDDEDPTISNIGTNNEISEVED